MKKIFTILMTLCITSMFSYGQTNDLSVEYDTGIEDQKTVSTEVLSSAETTHNLNTGNNSSGKSVENPVEKNSTTKIIVKRGERPPIDIMAAPEDAYEKGILKIKLKESFTNQLDNNPVALDDNGAIIFNISSVDQLNEQYSPTGFKRLFECDAFTAEYTERHRAWGFHLWYTLYFDENANIKELVRAYEQLDEVSTAEPEYKKVLSSTDSDKGGTVSPPADYTPNDPGYALQWHYHNTGQYSGTVDADIDLPEAWDLETGNSNIIVAVIDMGIQHNHPDLIGNMWSGIGYDFYNGNSTIEPGYHGTHVAGTVAAETNNGIGVAGVAGGTGSNDGVRLMSCQVFTPAGAGGGIELAPVWAADNDATISQNSWNYTSAGYYDQVVLDAIDYFNTNGGGDALSAGITIFSAGNNYGEGNYYPGAYSGTFAVAATDNHDVKAPYSTYGTWVDISAPGGDNSVIDERAVYSTYTTSTYDYIDGTSMACPHVSGTAALIISMAYGQLTPTDVADILRNTTDNIDALNPTVIGKMGTGRLNAYQALLETQDYLVTPGTLMPLPAQSGTFNGNTRGYWFTAPTDFIVTGLRVPIDISGDQTIEIVRFNSGTPPVFSGTTNDFTSLGRWVSVAGSGIIECNIPVSNGDHIGILGCRGTTTSYGANNFVTSINGNSVTLTRLGMQYQLPSTVAQDLWQEPTGTSLGRIEMYYESVPGIWTGVDNHFWNDADNWSDGTIPDAFTNVTIPAGTPNDCWVSTNDGFCNNITVESGSSLRIYDEVLTVSGSMTMNGLLKMEEWSGTPGELHIAGSMFWGSGSTTNITSNTLNMFVGANWEFQSGANVQMTNGYVTFEGGGNSWIRSYDEDCYFNNIRNSKTSLYGLAVSELSTEDLYISGNIYNYSGSLFRFRSDHSIILNGFFNNLGGNIQGQFGTFVFDNTAVIDLKPNTGDFFNNLTLSTSSPLGLDNTYSNLLTINGNVLIDAGGLEANNFTVEVAGNWINNVGTGGFVEGTSRVIFNGDSGHQYCSDETFNILEINKPDAAFRMGGTDVVCAAYDWTSGAVDVLSGSFTANDLLDNAIVGAFYNNTGGTINLINSGSGLYVDLNGELHIFGGTVNVTGSLSDWPYTNDALIEMSGGVLDFKTCGITIVDNAFDLIENITGGIIRTSEGFSGNRLDFKPNAGTFEFYGGSDYLISQSNGSTLFNVDINKSTKGSSSTSGQGKKVVNERTGEVISGGGKANSISLNSDFVVTNELTIDDGELILNGHTLTVTHDCNVNGILNMTNAVDVLNVGINYYDYLYFNSGSTGMLDEGIINIYGWIRPNTGSSVNAATTNTVYFKGGNGGGPWNNEPTATFGNMIVDKDPGSRTYVSLSSTQPVVLLGDLTVNPSNEFELQDHSVTVHGFLTDNMTSEIYLWQTSKNGNPKTSNPPDEAIGLNSSGATEVSNGTKGSGSKGGYFEIDNDFTLNGLLDVADGDVLLHGNFGISATGTLDITTGSLIADQGYADDKAWQYLNGTINLTDGLFEISNNSMWFSSTSVNNISGGIIRCGFSFYALDANVFKPTAGIVEFIGTGNDPRIELDASNYFYNILIDRAESIHLATDIEVINDVQIDSGPLFAYDYALTPHGILVGGNWTNNGGDAAFDEGTGIVTFYGTGDVAINNDESFYYLRLSKVNSGDWLTLYGDVSVNGNLIINPGALYSGSNEISVVGNVTVNSGGVLYMQSNSTLAIDGAQLVVFDGGYFYAVGTPGNEPVITRSSTGFYNFHIFGTIAAQNAIFEYMDSSGIFVDNTANVHPTYSFHNCTFRRGAPSPSALLVLNNDQDFTCNNAYFENTFGNTQYNVFKYYNTGNVTFETATGDFAGPEFEYDPYTRLHWGDIDVELDLAVMLEGAYNAGTMTTDLKDLGLIPLIQPFNSNPSAQWYYTGTESVGSIPPNVVDWVLVQIRDATDPALATSGTIVTEQAAFLLSDGRIVDLDGSSNISFTGIDYGTGLYPVIMHRNHIGVISSNIMPRIGGIHTLDFTVAGSAYSNTNLGQKNLGGGDWGMYSGDASGGGVINDFDLTFWSDDAGLKGYLQGDYNLNSQADNIDKNDYWYVNLNIMTQVPLSKSDDN